MDTEKRKKSRGNALDKNPYNRRGEKVKKVAFKDIDRSVKPVAKDTNKTRRKVVKPTSRGPL